MAPTGDFVHSHGSQIHAVQSCTAENGLDLVAIGGEHAVELLSCTDVDCSLLATFHIGVAVSAIAWSPRTISPVRSGEAILELVISGADGNLRHLCKRLDKEEQIVNLRGQFTGHRDKINGITYCESSSSEFNWRYVASVSDDRSLVVWDLFPDVDTESGQSGSPLSLNSDVPRVFPTAWTMQFANPLCSVFSHPQNDKELLISDNCGSVFIIDWHTDSENNAFTPLSVRKQITMEFIDPRSLAMAHTQSLHSMHGSVSWKFDDLNVIGGAFGDRWCLWDQSMGGMPFAYGPSFTRGTRRFRWCRTDCNLFAFSPHDILDGARLRIHHASFLNAPSHDLLIRPHPSSVVDFDWIGLDANGIPRLAIAVEKTLYIARIGDITKNTE